MARNVTRTTLRTRLRQRTNLEGHTNFLSDSECNDLLDEAKTEAWDILVASSPPDYFITSATISTAAGTHQYALAADFYKLRAVYVNEGNGEYRPITAMNAQERQFYRAPSGVYSVMYEYIHCAPAFDGDSGTFDGVNGWEELLVLTAAIKALQKEGTDTANLWADRQRLEQRIRSMAERNDGEPERVLRRARNARDPFRMMQNTVDVYRLTGSYLELFRAAGAYVI